MKINNDYKNRQFSFKALPFRVERGIKLFEEFHTTPSKFCPRDYFVRICNDDYLPKGVSIRVDNENYTTIGVSDLTIMPKKVLFNDNMDVFSRSNRSQGAGTAMHLAGIMTMLENGLEKLKLFSLGQAVHFHPHPVINKNAYHVIRQARPMPWHWHVLLSQFLFRQLLHQSVLRPFLQ